VLQKRLARFLLAAGGTGLAYLLYRHRDNLRIVQEGYRLYPEQKLNWTRLIFRLAGALREGSNFAAHYPFVELELAYGPHPRQRLDVYRPGFAASGRPVFVFVHGGGWQSGDKSMYAAAARELVSRGYLAVLISYRHWPEVSYPLFVQDAAAALRWVVDHIVDYGGDPGAIFIGGQSAGAHIAGCLALDCRFLAEQGLDSSVIRGVVGMSGPFELPRLSDYLNSAQGWDASPEHLSAIMGGEAGPVTASVCQYARPGAPPFLLLHGRDDRLVPFRQSELLAEALQAVEAPAQVRIMDQVNHFSMILNLCGRQPEAPDSVLDLIDQFVLETCTTPKP